MNILVKILTLLLLVAGFHLPLIAQKKLALANECFQAKAYHLASRYYQQVFDNSKNECHPDKIKMAQSLAATQQLEAASIVFERHMNCQRLNPADNIVYGKFLMDLKAYKKAIPYFEKAIEAEPDLARHYILVCQTAIPKPAKSEATFVNQTPDSALPKAELIKDAPSFSTFTVDTKSETFNKTKDPMITADRGQIDQTTVAINEINLYDAMTSANETSLETTQVITTTTSAMVDKHVTEDAAVIKEAPARIVVKKKISPYGVRLGTYNNEIIPDLSTVEQYGRIDKKKWSGKTIVFLVDFNNRAAAEAALKFAQREKFPSATLVKKLASGRMKSIR